MNTNGIILISGLKIFAYHGVLPEEQANGQLFILDLKLKMQNAAACRTDNLSDTVNYAEVVEIIQKTMTSRKDQLIERAAYRVAEAILNEYQSLKEVELILKKPDAPIDADFDFTAVCITLQRGEQSAVRPVLAHIAMGSNLGDRMQNLQNAVQAIAGLPGTSIIEVSSVYETKPQGFANQQDFLNAVAAVETEISPHALLGACLGIEAALGRIRTFRNGPRSIDLDLLTYGDLRIDSKELILPHPRIAGRAFVIIPLREVWKDGVLEGDSMDSLYDSVDKSVITLCSGKLYFDSKK